MTEASGIAGGGVKSVDIGKNTKGKGSLLEHSWHCCTKAWGAKRIRYPRSPRRKLWTLDIGSIDPFSVVLKKLTR